MWFSCVNPKLEQKKTAIFIAFTFIKNFRIGLTLTEYIG